MGLDRWLETHRMDELGRLDTPLHRIDARMKTVTALVFVVVVMSFPRGAVSALMPLFLYPLVLVRLGAIPPRALLKKMLVAAPFAVAVGLFNPVFDRQPVLVVGPVAVSGGWLSFASILIRFALTVSAALLLVACTGMHRLCAGLARLGVPRVLVVQLLFLYRYLFLIADEGARMLRGMELRAAGVRKLGLRVYGSLVGHLLLRSLARAERIYKAMLARGFDGEVRVAGPTRLRWADVAFMAAWAAFFAVARSWNLSACLGRLLVKGLS